MMQIFKIGVITVLGILVPALVLAQALPEEFFRAEVSTIVSERQEDIGIDGVRPYLQVIQVQLEGDREETIEYTALREESKLEVGDTVVVVETQNGQLHIFDRWRLPALAWIGVIFVGLALVFAGWRGITSLIGLGVSVLVLALYVVPRIMAGYNPLFVSFTAAVVIAVLSLYLAHGFNRRTSIALVSTLITVLLAIGLAQGFVMITGLTGSGSEEAYFLQTSQLSFVNLRGLLLGGIIIGALGVLDDITTSQAAAVEEIWRANPRLSRRELFKRGRSIGREHITSLINTLALAYAGASLPALLLFTLYERPWWVVMNTEVISEEIIRTLLGSVALMCAVPITTYLAAAVLSRKAQGGIQST